MFRTLRPARPSGALLSPGQLELALREGRTWSRTRDIRDIVGWDDFQYAAELALPALQSRLARFPSHATTHFFPVPKPTPGKLRSMVCADAFDEAIYRALVGEIATQVELSLGAEVQSYRLRQFFPTWKLRSHRYGDVERRSQAKEFVCGGDAAEHAEG